MGTLYIGPAPDEWIPSEEIRSEISVCSDCLFSNVNGEYDPDRPADLPEPWSAIRFGFTVTPGGNHSAECDAENADTPEWSGRECDCDTLGFSTYACEGCGDWHHGDRYRFTLWQTTLDAARTYHYARLRDSAHYRRQGQNGFAADMRAEAAQWREYIAFRLKEESDHRRWMERHAVAVSNGFA